MKSLIVSMMLLGSISSFAADQKGDHPCHKIEAACESAGFIKKHHNEKKGLYLDCMQPILAGNKVAGVNVADSDVAACKEKKAEHHKK
ncbi:MAG TPA: hypothetical protein VN132_08990 [Bdellovibrio sp.]|nr:hypothetical protein [Bdellovibrio sp.]